MSDTPETLWIETDYFSYVSEIAEYGRKPAAEELHRFTEYTRTGHALALVAAAYEDAAAACADAAWRRDGDDAYTRGLDNGALEQAAACATAVRARTPDDARAALEKVKREAREEALPTRSEMVEAAAMATFGYGYAIVGVAAAEAAVDAILALIEKEKTNV